MKLNPATHSPRVSIALAIGIIFQGASLLPAQLVNVDFNQNNGLGWGGGGPNPGPTMSGAAVLGGAGDYWNGVNLSSGSHFPLKYSDGSSAPVTLTFTAGGGYDVHSFGGSSPFDGTPYGALMEDYLYTGGIAQNILLSDLKPNAAYRLVLYSSANGGAAGRTTYFTANGITRASVWDASSSALTEGVNYANFNAALSDSGGKLAIVYSGDGNLEGDLNGFQIQAAPLRLNASLDGTNIAFSFVTQAGLSYEVQFKTNLTGGEWSSLGGVISGNDSIKRVRDNVGPDRCWYRVQVSTNSASTLSRLHTTGTNIVNASGEVVQLRGLNLGGWFIMEKWMCPLDNGSLPDTYSVITNLDARFGVAMEQSLIRTYQTNWITTDDLDNIADAGYNCVRMPVWWGNFYSITNTTSSGWRSDAFTVLDWLVANCATRGIYVIFDLHGVVGGQSNSDSTGRQNQNQFWASSLARSQTAYLWSQIASHYQGNNAVAGYDLINEPFGTTSTGDVWPVYASLYTTVRTADPDHIIIMEGTFGSWNWSMLPNPSLYGWTNIVYSMHEYQWDGSVAQIQAGADNQVADFKNHAFWNVPDFVGEWNNMGMGAACYDYSINAYDQAGISWAMWSYKATHGLVPDGWGWYDPVYWPPTPNISSDSASKIAADWQQWRTTTTFGVNASVGL